MFLVTGGINGKWSAQKAMNRLSKAKATAFTPHVPSQEYNCRMISAQQH